MSASSAIAAAFTGCTWSSPTEGDPDAGEVGKGKRIQKFEGVNR